MQQVDAIFEEGMFKPVGPVSLEEKQRVRLKVEPLPEAGTRTAQEWLQDMAGLRRS